MATQAINCTLVLNAKKVHSVRFTAVGEKPAFRDVYLSNEDFKALGEPQKIVIKVEASK